MISSDQRLAVKYAAHHLRDRAAYLAVRLADAEPTEQSAALHRDVELFEAVAELLDGLVRNN